MNAKPLFNTTEPVIGIRAVHLDLKGLPPTPTRLIRLLDLFKLARYNAVLVEWEDTFPWKTDRRFRGETCYSEETIAAFHAHAAELGINVIPLVQCLGHMEIPLQIDDYAKLREVPDRTDGLNPLAPGAIDLVRSMIDDVLEPTTPTPRFFHIGGDEAMLFGTHPDTKAYIEEHGKAALYLKHIEPLLDHLIKKGIRPILWHDMMIEWPEEALTRLSAKADLMIWGYQETPYNTQGHYSIDVVKRMATAHGALWGAGAFKCGESGGDNLPPADEREANILGWVRAADEFKMKGVCATGWSRNSSSTPQYAPLDVCLDLILQTGIILHDGKPHSGGLEACAEALDAFGGERDSFKERRDAMAHFEATCNAAWEAVRGFRHYLANLEEDPTRCESGHAKPLLAGIKIHQNRIEKAGKELLSHFKGLVDDAWIERLVKSQAVAIAHEYEDLK
ncbi:MAG: family 20 glycosylhydrolase [Verrucomicrobiota bacterium]